MRLGGQSPIRRLAGAGGAGSSRFLRGSREDDPGAHHSWPGLYTRAAQGRSARRGRGERGKAGAGSRLRRGGPAGDLNQRRPSTTPAIRAPMRRMTLPAANRAERGFGGETLGKSVLLIVRALPIFRRTTIPG